MSGARLKHYGWGRKNEGMTAEEQGFVLGRYHAKFARDAFETRAVPRLEDRHCGSRASRCRPHLPLSVRANAATGSRTPTANPIRTTCELCSATTIARPTWSHIRKNTVARRN